MTLSHDAPDTGSAPRGVSRRGFFGYVLAAGTLVVAADLGTSAPAAASVPSPPQPPELYDLNDALTDAALPTSQLITVTVHSDGTASFALPRAEVGQGITTSTAMIIAEELDLPVEKVRVTLAPARPELLFNQLTGGSNTTIATFTPIRVAAAIAKQQLLEAAALLLGSNVALLVSKAGVISAPDGSSATYGELATKAAASETKQVTLDPSALKAASEFKVLGKPRTRVDALDIVTGRKQFAMDLDVPGALPTMVCRPPTLNGRPKAILNKADVLALPGVTDVALIPTGVAVRAETFGQCIDGVRALRVDWGPGSVEGQDDASVLANLRKAELPLAVPKVPLLTKTVDADFEFMFRSSAALEPYAAVADVRSGSAEIWAGLKSPIVAQSEVAQAVGLPQDKVKVNVITGGGSFGHKLFGDHAVEAAQASKAFGKPVRLMWHRADEPRQGRLHPMATSRLRATLLAGNVLTFEQRHTSVETSFRHGLGEALSSVATKLPTGLGNLGVAETIFALTQEVPYNFGVVDQLLTETDQRFNTGSMRNVYSPDVGCAAELMVDILAKAVGKDPLDFRLEFLKSDVVKGVLRKVAEVGGWGRAMPAGCAQGIAIHKEYKGASACLVEIDCRPETVNRKIRDGVAGPRVTKAVVAIDAGLVVNPRGLEAQMMGGFADGLALALTSSVHLKDGHFLEASWDNYFYTRQWNVPTDFTVVVTPSHGDQPGGAGEASVACSFAAVACAYARATGKVPKRFPINHDDPIGFEVKSFVPPVPASPTDGLDHTY
ncbi:molybdopterin cofactor-binding domain-containing protein [Amycolatopsis sp. SID8362]|uniref:molybdopterin cofactor-binding domain-containing protein n=1 Tax=Amycolatopsis sp. SID8362 TaxID=2690346 RepID=UPI00136B4D9F|nr:molybdopterin cofactor-binding domain-containing protein [Amycolatopsis sp. SID8362]NBH08535.1 molybdopterin-dependent oxidoreductase [Amycolatopsis sp. SID8362]NED45229.1 xanthine dehydrogenase family protein molybdopterin-binding subunit [Amycolatopsis sp. SID8362]